MLFEPRIGDCLLHGDVVPGRALPHEASGAPIEHLEWVELGGAMHLATEAELSIFRRERDTRPRGLQAFQHFGNVIADGGYDPHAGDDDSSHLVLAQRPLPAMF